MVHKTKPAAAAKSSAERQSLHILRTETLLSLQTWRHKEFEQILLKSPSRPLDRPLCPTLTPPHDCPHCIQPRREDTRRSESRMCRLLLSVSLFKVLSKSCTRWRESPHAVCTFYVLWQLNVATQAPRGEGKNWLAGCLLGRKWG